MTHAHTLRRVQRSHTHTRPHVTPLFVAPLEIRHTPIRQPTTGHTAPVSSCTCEHMPTCEHTPPSPSFVWRVRTRTCVRRCGARARARTHARSLTGADAQRTQASTAHTCEHSAHMRAQRTHASTAHTCEHSAHLRAQRTHASIAHTCEHTSAGTHAPDRSCHNRWP